jgi:hypothetical protein
MSLLSKTQIRVILFRTPSATEKDYEWRVLKRFGVDYSKYEVKFGEHNEVYNYTHRMDNSG